jgi:hypothetical protein
MRVFVIAFGFLMVLALVTGHVDTRPARPEGHRVPAYGARVPSLPSVPAGVEVLFLVR